LEHLERLLVRFGQATNTRFKPGDRIKVKFEERPGHIRTPHFLRGKTGWIKEVYGDFLNPESLGHGGDGLPMKMLYLVGFRQRDVWGDRYEGPEGDTVYADIFEHWLESA
jgi:nitrile hydratase